MKTFNFFFSSDLYTIGIVLRKEVTWPIQITPGMARDYNRFSSKYGLQPELKQQLEIGVGFSIDNSPYLFIPYISSVLETMRPWRHSIMLDSFK